MILFFAPEGILPANGLHRGLEGVEHLLPGAYGPAQGLHHEAQDPCPAGGQDVRQELVPQHGGLVPPLPARAMAFRRPSVPGFLAWP